MTNKTLEYLSIANTDAIFDVFKSRATLGSKSPSVDPDLFKKSICQTSTWIYTNYIGLFDNGTLDTFISLKYPDKMSPPYTGDSCAIVGLTATMKRSNRKKTSAGWDVNNTILINYMIEELIKQKRWTHWLLTPTAFAAYAANPDLERHKNGDFDAQTIETVVAGSMPQDPTYGSFIKTYMMTHPMQEDWNVRRTSLRSSLRI